MSHAMNEDELLDTLQRETFGYFLHQCNPVNGLIADSNQTGVPASIAAVGLALAAYLVGVERGFVTREEARERTLAILRFFWNSPQGNQPDATGYRGFYYHFLDMQTGRRSGQCELSTIDTAILLAGILAVQVYFQEDSEEEQEIYNLADALYRRVDWKWAQNGEATVAHGWKPECGFLPYRWTGYTEALFLYIFGLGSPTHPLPEESYAGWQSTYEWKEINDHELVYAGPLFIHQLSHVWIDFRGIQDAFIRERGLDYFENSRRAAYVHQQYAIRNPLGFKGYGEHAWGFSASAGPGWETRRVRGVERHFFGYVARGAPFGPDDGTISPWATMTSLPFAPEIVLPAWRHFEDIGVKVNPKCGCTASFNPTYPSGILAKFGLELSQLGWVSPWSLGLDQGPIILMIENYRSGFLWRLMKQCPYLVAGLRRARFANGWLEGA